jgi:2-(1,2-epoxy-1,2-dihydrophenyl)acetyl-CoA isomerase
MKAMSYQKIKVGREGDVAVITLADPATMNALGVDTAAELLAAYKEAVVGATPARAILLTGEGRGFCSGANLQPRGSGGGGASVDGDGRPDAGSALETVYNPLVTYIREASVPLVTAVNGAAAGVGCSLALLGDLIVAGESAYFLQAFRRIGLVPDGGSTYLLPRAIGRARAMEMALLGERVPAAQALEWGMINRVVADAELAATGLALASALATGPASLGLSRQILWASLDADWPSQLHRERLAQKTAGKTADFGEGVRAFLEKRPAAFSGR